MEGDSFNPRERPILEGGGGGEEMSVIKIPLLHVLLPGAKQVVTTIHPSHPLWTDYEGGPRPAVQRSSHPLSYRRDKAGARDGTGVRVADMEALEGHAIDNLRTRAGSF